MTTESLRASEPRLEGSGSGPWPRPESATEYPCGSDARRDHELPKGVVQREVLRTRHGSTERILDHIAEEIPVALVYNDTPFAVMMATPADLDDFARGFTITEGIASTDEIAKVEHRELLEGHELRIAIPEARAESLAARRRSLTGRSGCGLCGTEMLEAALREPPRVTPSAFALTNEALQAALAQLPLLQPINALTGATHAAAWCDARGDIVLCREDVGRHNALDKLVGAMARRRIDAAIGFALVTSRASYEIVTKAAAAGIRHVAAVSGATALAMSIAERTGVRLAAFARPGSSTACGRLD